MNNRDPIGSGPPPDEYDCLVAQLLTLLQSGASEQQVETYLHNELVEHFGLSPNTADIRVVAARIWHWYDRPWRIVAEPVTIFIALVGEGVDVWRPVLARPLPQGLFRVVGVDADVSDETWRFPAGSIVKCEQKQFSDGTVHSVAVEHVGRAG